MRKYYPKWYTIINAPSSSNMFRYAINYSFILFTILLSLSGCDTKNQGSAKDQDGNSYSTVKIGDQVWMAENLNVEHYRNGDPIPQVQDKDQWASLKTGAWCYYENDPANGNKYGKLYNWYAVNDIRGLAPKGWHIPTKEEFEILEINLSGDGNSLKAIGQGEFDGIGTNKSGFSALITGHRHHSGSIPDSLIAGYDFWSSSEYDAEWAYILSLWGSSSDFHILAVYKEYGFSVRCLKDGLIKKIKKYIKDKVKYEILIKKFPSYPDQLNAIVNNKVYNLISEKDEMCLSIYESKDFDGDGFIDVLMEHIIGCGGNCCGNSYFFYSYKGDGNFMKSESFGYSWDGATIEEWKGKWSVKVTSKNLGTNTDQMQEKTERFILQDGIAIKVEEFERKHIEAQIELRADMFDWNEFDEKKILVCDLDNDGIDDKIIGRLWHRWGTIMWEVHFANGYVYPDGGSKRIGVLQSETNGVRDLVGDFDDIYRWDGKTYVLEK